MEKVISFLTQSWTWFKGHFVSTTTTVSKKAEINQKNIVITLGGILILFVVVALFLPTEDTRVFREIKDEEKVTEVSMPRSVTDQNKKSPDTKLKASRLWNGGESASAVSSGQSQINYNTAMVMGGASGNSRDQLYAGYKVRLQNVDKFVASQDGTPIIARAIESATTESGMTIPAGSIFYGEATYQAASDKAQIKFSRASFPDGRILDMQAVAIDESGQSGLSGNVKSDAVKNSAGQVLTAFVGGLAAGSVSRDVFGQSAGGLKNGLLQAFADTAKDRASQYGEKMKEAREWIEIESGVYFDAVIQQSVTLKQESNQGDGL